MASNQGVEQMEPVSKHWKILVLLVGFLISVVIIGSRSALEVIWSYHQDLNCTRTTWLHLPLDQTNLSDHSQYGPNIYGQYSVTLSVFLQALHIPEFLALLWGYLYRSERNICDQRCRNCPTYCCSVVPIVLILWSYFLVGFCVSFFQLPLTYCKTDAPSWWLPLFRGLLTMVVHIFTFLARAFMAWQCIRGFGVFWEATTIINNVHINTIGQKPFRKASMIHKGLTVRYKEVADKVGPIVGIFTSWFFIMWILYTIGTITNVVYVLRAWFLTISLSETQLVYELLYIGYNLLSYGIPYVLALELKGCHTKYYKELKDKQAAIAKDKDLYGYTTTMCITKIDDCDFVPSLFGITLPLESIQFAIPVLLPIISLAWGFLKN